MVDASYLALRFITTGSLPKLTAKKFLCLFLYEQRDSQKVYYNKYINKSILNRFKKTMTKF